MHSSHNMIYKVYDHIIDTNVVEQIYWKFSINGGGANHLV